MKASDVKVGVIYVNRGAGRTQRKVLAIGDEHRPAHWLGTWGSIPPNEPGILYEQKGKQYNLYLSSFAAWAKGPVDGAKTVLARLEAIRKADLVADLVKDLLAAGVTEEQLHGMLQGRMGDPLVNEFYNKFRDLSRSDWTFNRHGERVIR